MPTIALIDDDAQKRESVVTGLKPFLHSGWKIIDGDPLKSAKSYPAWLLQNEVSVLVIDWRLDEQRRGTQRAVNYQADAVVAAVRKKRPNFPIWVITAYQDETMVNHGSDVEQTMKRDALTSEPKMQVERMIRAGARFDEQHHEGIARIANLAAKIASGKGNKKDRDTLQSLRVQLGLAESFEDALSQAERLDAADKLKKDAEKLTADIKKLLKPRKKK